MRVRNLATLSSRVVVALSATCRQKATEEPNALFCRAPVLKRPFLLIETTARCSAALSRSRLVAPSSLASFDLFCARCEATLAWLDVAPWNSARPRSDHGFTGASLGWPGWFLAQFPREEGISATVCRLSVWVCRVNGLSVVSQGPGEALHH